MTENPHPADFLTWDVEYIDNSDVAQATFPAWEDYYSRAYSVDNYERFDRGLEPYFVRAVAICGVAAGILASEGYIRRRWRFVAFGAEEAPWVSVEGPKSETLPALTKALEMATELIDNPWGNAT